MAVTLLGYPHTVDRVLKAARTVPKKNGVIERESKIMATNTMGVEEISPGTTQLSVPALNRSGAKDQEIIDQSDKEIALELTK